MIFYKIAPMAFFLPAAGIEIVSLYLFPGLGYLSFHYGFVFGCYHHLSQIEFAFIVGFNEFKLNSFYLLRLSFLPVGKHFIHHSLPPIITALWLLRMSW